METIDTSNLDEELVPFFIKTKKTKSAPIRLWSIETECEGRPLLHKIITVEGPNGPIEITIFENKSNSSLRPLLYNIHGGGMVGGNRYSNLRRLLDLIEPHNMIVATVEYHLAPKIQGISLVEECYTGLLHLWENASSYGIDKSRIIAAGCSAGGNLCASLTFLCRDRNVIDLKAQMLFAPMLDYHYETASARQYGDTTTLTVSIMESCWEQFLGKSNNCLEVNIYCTPGRATNLENLPDTYVDVGSAEVFRDDCIQFVNRLYAAGNNTEFHVWRGCYHSHEYCVPDASISKETWNARKNWVARILTS
ncbi:Alpha/Beta hydrolase protein [Dipodascopsis uninucleata]